MIKTTGFVRRNPRDDLLTSEISLQSLFYLFNTSDANYISDLLFRRKSELEELMKSNLSSEELIDLLRMLVNIYNLKNSNKRSQLLAITHSEEFVNNIKKFLQCIRNDEHSKEVVDFIMHFVDVNINELPISDVCYNRFYSLLKVLLDDLPEDKFNVAFLWTHELRLLLQKKIIHWDRTKHKWKDLNIYPCAVDLFEKKDLMPNKINGAYKNTEEYLDIIFKLLKEDYEGSLREGILQIKAELRGTKTTEKDVFLYNNVNIERIETDENVMNGIIHRIAFSVGNKENQLSNINEHFKYGSLLLLSRYSQFTTFVLATVVDDVELQNTENDTYKVLKVSIVDELSQIKPYWRYTMLETKVLFNPYYEVLNAIQSKSIENFPMEKYIVYLDTTPCIPRYISIETEYKIDCKSVKLFSSAPWPDNLLNLDSSQVEALRTALTYELVLIQGPPGSGKTHLTRTIIDVLIDNKSFLSTPILLISSDNYSVDIILEALAIKKRNVIRLGNRTKSSVLKKCLLHQKIKPFGRDTKNKIERIKESLLRKINQNEENIEKMVEYLKREQSSHRDACDENFALQILSGKFDVIGGTTAGCARLHHLLEKVQPEVVIVENANEILEAHVIAALSEGCKHLILIGDHKQLKPNISNRNLENYDLDVSLFERMMRSGMKCFTLIEQHRMRPEIASLLSPTVYQIMKNHPVVHDLKKIRGMKRNMFFINHEVAENKKKDDEHSYSNKHEGDFLLGLANYLLLQGYSLKELTILVPYAEQLKYMIRAAKTYPLLKGIEILTIDTYSGHENTIILLSLVRSQSAGIGFLTNNNKIVVALSRAKSGLYIIGNMKTLMSGSELWVSLNAVLKRKQAIDRSIHLECETHKTITEVSNKEDFKLLSSKGGCILQCNLPLDCGHLCKLKCHPLLEEHTSYICSECGQCKDGLDVILPCGHSLKIKNHANNKEHTAYICNEPCSRNCKQNLHLCKKKCFEECGPCNENIDVILPCGHSSKKKCCVDAEDHITAYVCKEPCLRFCQQDLHKCSNRCYEECGKCNEYVDVILPCGHSSKKKCCVDKEEHIAAFVCNEPCLRYCKQNLHQRYIKCSNEEYEYCNEDVAVPLPCGHVSMKKCSDNTQKHLAAYVCYEPCSKFCEQDLHKCSKKCYEVCGKCNEDVDVILPCGHSSKKKCCVGMEEHIAVYICNEPCLRFCEQDLHKCNKRCYEKCGKCNEEVDVILPCGHSSKKKCCVDKEEHIAAYVCNEPSLRYCKQNLHQRYIKCSNEEYEYCDEDVAVPLPCGHVSMKKCSDNTEKHLAAYVCYEPCSKFCEQDLHRCSKSCYEECGKCNEDFDVILPCGHSSKKKCCADKEVHIAAYICYEPCSRFCEQDLHKCSKSCYEECGKCNEDVDIILPCGHLSKKKCCISKEEHIASYICNEPCSRYCQQNLHRCEKKCNEKCEDCYEDFDVILPCGHSSKKKCCVDMEEHIATYVCNEPCLRLCKQGLHKCNKRCYEECGKCNEDAHVILPCGHSSRTKCYTSSEELTGYRCNEPCLRFCEQDLHKCRKRCYEKCEKCNEEVVVILPCGHSSTKKCSVDKEEHIAAYVCNEPCLRFCEQNLHKCNKRCYEECRYCDEDIDVILSCGHATMMKCSDNQKDLLAAYICYEPCLRFCEQDLHKCSKRCYEECGKCNEDVDVILPCGHLSRKKCCINKEEYIASYICNETCSRYCQQNLHRCEKKCNEKCEDCYEDFDVILPCGHASKKKCCVNMEEYIATYVCNEPCLRFCEQNLHKCNKRCYEDCKYCDEDIDVILPCGHATMMKCSDNQKELLAAYICYEPCSRFCKQGLHKCNKRCYEECGKCNEDADVILPCGHSSRMKCYTSSEGLTGYRCNEPCLRFCEQDLHRCSKRCYEECGKCNEDVDVILPCGHSSKKKCADKEEHICYEPCLRFCEQDLHQCSKRCYEECGKCNEDVDVILPCGHSSKKKCCVDKEEHIASYICNETFLRYCQKNLHQCEKKCNEKCEDCFEDVDVILPCGHSSKKKCCVDMEEHIATYVCNEPCLRFCEQNLHKCNKRCYEECRYCDEDIDVILPCGHATMMKCSDNQEELLAAYICYEPCSRFCEQDLHKCNKRCYEECGKCNEDVDVILPCGHSSKKKCCVDKEVHIAAYVCYEPCLRICEQDLHKCNKKCYEECGYCDEDVYIILLCGHETIMKCSDLLAAYTCNEPCSRFCKQDLHKCNKRCYEECGKCNEDADVILPCGHSYRMKCYASSEELTDHICNEPCLRFCERNQHQCKKKCNEECGDCFEDVDLILSCGHLSKLKCHANKEEHIAAYICNEPCLRFCKENLHKCMKKCYEECEQCNEDVDVILPCGHSSKKKCCADKEDINICTKPIIVSYLFCLRKVVPCWQSNSCFYRKVEEPA